MKNIPLIILFFLFAAGCTAQQYRFGVSAGYLYSRSWDKAIQTYNFSRPDLVNKQPLLIYGYGADFGVVTDTFRTLNHGIHVHYNHNRSRAENDNFRSVLNVHLISCAFLLQYRNTKGDPKLFVNGEIGVQLGGVFRRVNDESIASKATGLGIGGIIGTECGYELTVWRPGLSLAPFAAARFSAFYGPRGEAVLNQTVGMTGKKWSVFATANVGIYVIIHYHTLRPRLR